MGINTITMGIWSASAAAHSSGSSGADPYFSNVALLMHANDFIDNSVNNATMANLNCSINTSSYEY